MGKGRVLLPILVVVLVSLVTVEFADPAPAPGGKTIVLKQNVYTPAGHGITHRALEFSRRVAAATEGRVKIEVYPAESLCPAKEELGAARAGTIDMTATVMQYLVGMVPLFNFAALPWVIPPSAEDTAKALLEIMPIIDKAIEGYNVHLLHLEMNPSNYCLVTRKEVRTPADLKGLKIRTGGGLMDALGGNWGAAVVSIPAPETYAALQRGLADATMLTIPSVKSFKVYEIAPYITDLSMGMGGLQISVNKNKWQQISNADQKAMTDLIPEYILWAVKNSVEDIAKSRGEWPGLGVKQYVPTPAEMALWKAGGKPLWERYASTSPEAKKIVDICLKYGGGVK